MKRQASKKISRSWQKKKRKKRISFRFKVPKVNFSKFKFSKIKLRKLLPGAAVFIVAFSSMYAVVFSGYFTVKHIVISGNNSVEQSKIEEAARSQFSSRIYGFIPGDNLLFLDKGKITKKISSDFSEIEGVEVARKFPNSLEIVVKEKTPALIWCRTNCYFVNNQGIAFLQADGRDVDSQNSHYIKIIEEKEIAEEKQEGSPNDSAAVSPSTDTSPDIADNENNSEIGQANIATENDNRSVITMNEEVSDESFINFAIDINSKIGYNLKVKIKYYKTKGTRSRELIAFTDKNMRVYFDTTQSAEKQAENLDEFLEKGIEKDKIDAIKYIYLKNDDRVFYK